LDSLSVALGNAGLPSTNQDPERTRFGLRNLYILEILVGPMSFSIRTSIALYLLPLAVRRWHRIVIYTIIGITAAASVAFLVIMALQCTPPEYFWTKASDPEAQGTCIHPAVVPIATVAFSVVCALGDWAIGLLPIAILWHVKINLRTKWAIRALLGMGLM
jgi:hypothetical protein